MNDKLVEQWESKIANVWDSTIQPVNEQRFYLEK